MFMLLLTNSFQKELKRVESNGIYPHPPASHCGLPVGTASSEGSLQALLSHMEGGWGISAKPANPSSAGPETFPFKASLDVDSLPPGKGAAKQPPLQGNLQQNLTELICTYLAPYLPYWTLTTTE